MSEKNEPEKARAIDGAAADAVDRIVLRRVENDRLQGWVAALNARFDGMIRVTKSDLANFIVRQHSDSLSESEIKTIETEMFDEVRWLNWALAKVRQAKKVGQSLSLNDLMVKRESIKSRKSTPPNGARVRQRRRGSVEVAEEPPEVPNYADLEEG